MNAYLQFANSWYFCLLLIPLALLLLRQRRSGAQFGGWHILRSVMRPSRGPFIYRLIMALGLCCLITAAARPQYGSTIKENTSEGRDLMLVIDLSGSMRLDDMTNEQNERITRLAAVMNAAKAFIDGRPNDRMGLVFFSEEALVSCPLTRDHGTLHNILARTQATLESLWSRNNDLLGQGTDIGLGLGYAMKTLDKRAADEAQENTAGRAIILITDGRDSKGHREPLIAARHARNAGIRIHSIGVGDPQGTFTKSNAFGQKSVLRIGRNQLPDMNLLRKIAKQSSGIAMSAGNRDELKTVFEKIDELEPSPRTERVREHFEDRFVLPLLIGLICCALGLLLEPRLRGPLP